MIKIGTFLVMFILFAVPAFGQFGQVLESRKEVDQITSHADKKDGKYRDVVITNCDGGGNCVEHQIREKRPPSKQKKVVRAIASAALGAAIGGAVGGPEGALYGAGIGGGTSALVNAYGRDGRSHRESLNEYNRWERLEQERYEVDTYSRGGYYSGYGYSRCIRGFVGWRRMIDRR
ncbi:MAG: hypothetical protein COV29_02745 [Candidatus Yanofskybacteria bacterium CG10_big_fil_rev_8_21_14_0_10_36_16]|uniref:Glycine zipper domain-containing protein n=1 Tax=Candidatus Yanofskybacteria bacterium CG10_big_fil_rev_8_21_14_0_10_36_16 TaxID=1975096 RepID=A0A2J0Q7V9_9BACT|nr:MAG: hypothetical protein COV29_02745 [Candidatus Yanofskybacteria bacterium CG10_big_fil_rev_8_21_14_0_10_36_16]